MLALSRKLNEEIKIGRNITVKVLAIRGGKVLLGIDAPKDTAVTRPDAVRTMPTAEYREQRTGRYGNG